MFKQRDIKNGYNGVGSSVSILALLLSTLKVQ